MSLRCNKIYSCYILSCILHMCEAPNLCTSVVNINLFMNTVLLDRSSESLRPIIPIVFPTLSSILFTNFLEYNSLPEERCSRAIYWRLHIVSRVVHIQRVLFTDSWVLMFLNNTQENIFNYYFSLEGQWVLILSKFLVVLNFKCQTNRLSIISHITGSNCCSCNYVNLFFFCSEPVGLFL